MQSRLIRAAAIILICAWALIAEAAPSTRRALVIGNDSYPGNALHNARNDARSVADGLKLDDFQTTLALDVDRKSMMSAIDHFAEDTGPGDIVVLYYAGHGLQVAGENYLVPTDFVVTTPGDVKSQGVALSSLLDLLTTHGVTTQIVILDACRDNPFLGSRSMGGGWASMGTSAGTFLAFGTSPGSTASDDPDQPHGLFTLSLLKYLSTSNLDIEQMFQKVRLDVIEQSHGQQIPWTATSLVGSFHFRPELDRNAASVPSPLAQVTTATVGASPSRSVNTGSASAPPTAPNVPNTAAGGSTQILLQQAITEIQKGQLESAADALKSALADDPNCAIAANLLGLVLQSMGHETEASQVLNHEISLNPRDVDAYINRCVIESSSKATSTVNDCEAAVQLNPTSSEAHVALADSLFEVGDVHRAYDEATRSIELSPNESTAFALRGRIAASQGYSGIAHQDYQRAVNLKLRQETSEQ